MDKSTSETRGAFIRIKLLQKGYLVLDEIQLSIEISEMRWGTVPTANPGTENALLHMIEA